MRSNNQHIAASTDSSFSLTERFLAPYRQQLADSFSAVIAITETKLIKKRPGGSLGNLVTEAMWLHTKLNTPGTSQAPPATFVLMNYGGIRLKEIAAGSISIGKIFELLPFENTLVRIDLNGANLKKLLQQVNKVNGWPMKFNNKKFKSLEDINPRQRFELITNNYIAQGGDNCSILKTLPQEDTGILLRDIVIEYLKKQKTVKANNTDYILK